MRTQSHVDDCPLCTRHLDALRGLGQALYDSRSLGDKASTPTNDPPNAMGTRSRTLRLRQVAAWSEEGLVLAQELLGAARSGEAELVKSLALLSGRPAFPYALLYACQKGARLASQDPQGALRLAQAIQVEALSLEDGSTSISRGRVLADACLLSSQALLSIGRIAESIQAVSAARRHFDETNATPFHQALCDYFEGTGQGFAGQDAHAERLLKHALQTFAEHGQEHWMGRAEINLGLVLGQRGDERRAIGYLDQGLARLDSDDDAHAVAAGLINRGSCQAHLGEYDAARSSYATALRHTTTHDLSYYRHQVRAGLAELEFLKCDFARALQGFAGVNEEARAQGYEENVTFSALYLAECHARLGKNEAMAAAVESLRAEWQRRERRTRFETPASPAIEELFSCLDRGDLDAGLIRHVRLYLESDDERAGISYRAYRTA